MAHRLDPLVNPESVAVVGASVRTDSVGYQTLRNLLDGRFTGPLYAVNPGYEEIDGVPCYPNLAALPGPAQHVVFAVGDARIEAAFEEAVDHHAAACTIFSALTLADDDGLKERVRARAEASGILLAGGNGMGFYNFSGGVRVCGFETRCHDRPGNVALLSQSGSGMAGILDVDERLDFCFAASSGQELVVGLEDYLDYVLDLPELRVVGLFMETSRKPAALRAALAKARARDVPVVALKVGRTALAARLAISHSGAMAGADGAFEALFDRYGVQRVADMAELATALIMFAQPRHVGDGGLVSLHDSGGERQLMVDLAARFGVPLTELDTSSVAALEAMLDPGLPAINPLDAWSAGGTDADRIMDDAFTTLMRDRGAALGALVLDRGPGGRLQEGYLDPLRQARDATGKPVFLVSNGAGATGDSRAVDATHEGLPVVDGLAPFLAGARAMLGYRDAQRRPEDRLPTVREGVVARWREGLAAGGPHDEFDAARLLRGLGVPMVDSVTVGSRGELESIAGEIDYPVVLKTAAPLAHKTDVGGVVLNLTDAPALLGAYDDLTRRFGARVLLAPMIVQPGVEMLLGVAQDAQFGALVTLGFGGVQADVVRDVVFALPPFGPGTARRCLDRLRLRPLLDAVRGRPALAVSDFCRAAACLSVLAARLADWPVEIEVNPLKLTPQGCVGLDALVVCHEGQSRRDGRRAHDRSP